MPVRSASGIALVLVIGILGLLSVLAGSFLTLAQLERRASAQRLHATKAGLLARSGLEDALARLSAGQDTEAPANRYGGENWDGDPNGLLSPLEAPEQVYNRTAVGTKADIDACPVRQAMRPSFFARLTSGNPDPALVTMEGRKRGYSGRLSGDPAAGGHQYVLKVEDESAKINVNGGFLDRVDRDADGVWDYQDPQVRAPGAPPRDTGMGWNAQLKRVLDVLGQQPEVAIPTLGTLVLQNRPLGGYRSMAQLETVVGRDLSPYLTNASWVDTKVVHPNGYVLGNLPLVEIKRLRQPLVLEAGGRPPVNLNAASRPVLIALIQGLKGLADVSASDGHLGYQIPPSPLVPNMARDIAMAMTYFRAGRDPGGFFASKGLLPGPFESWPQFNAFCDALVPEVLSGFNTLPLMMPAATNALGNNLAAADLLKANFDPNTQLNKQFPDELLFRWIDKSDLMAWSTEGSLGPTGVFRVTALGRVVAPGGHLLAQAQVGATLRAFELLRQTTQKDFVGGRPSPQAYASLAADLLVPTTGASASWNTWGAGIGLSVMTYPCPVPALPGKAADFDGTIGLGTLEMAPRDPSGGQLLFLHHMDDGWDAEPLATNPLGNPARIRAGWDRKLQPDVGESVWPGSSIEPNTLLPDGEQVQTDRSPVFRAQGNLPPADSLPSNHGVLAYWVKPLIVDVTASERMGAVSAPDFVHFSCVRSAGSAGYQSLVVGRHQDYWGIVAENSLSEDDVGRERQSNADYQWQPPGVPARVDASLFPGLRWCLVLAAWDTDETTLGQDVRVEVQSLRGRARTVSGAAYRDAFHVPFNEDLLGVGALVALGPQAASSELRGRDVLDEIAICDFMDAAGPAWTEAARWAQNRYKDGRYYKNDAAFLSVLLEPGEGRPVRLLKASWTAYLPGQNRQEVWGKANIPGDSEMPAWYVGFPQPHAMTASGQSRRIDPTLVDARIEVDLLDRAGNVLQTLSQNRGLGRTLSSFQYRVRFRPTPTWSATDRLDQPVLESPFFDDITFAYQGAQGPAVLSWE